MTRKMISKKKSLIIGMLLSIITLITIAIQPALAQWVKFRLEPGDPHFVRLDDEHKVLKDKGDYWECNIKGDKFPPGIIFKLPEIKETGGKLKFTFEIHTDGKRVKLSLLASKDGKSFRGIWSCTRYSDIRDSVAVDIPKGYTYFYFWFIDDSSVNTYIRLWKEMEVYIPHQKPKVTISIVEITGYTLVSSITIAGILLILSRIMKI